MITSPLIHTWLLTFRDGIDAESEQLNLLDAALGDGDYGASMQRGLAAVAVAIDGLEAAPIDQLLGTAGRTIVSAIGGTSGPLVGSLFLAAGAFIGEVTECTAAQFVDGLRAGASKVMSLGGAEVGDKTMIDALVPTLDGLDASLAAGEAAADSLAAAASIAAAAAEATSALAARRGRASYTGTGGRGHVDPGARGIAILFEALAQSMAKQTPTTY